MNPQLYHTIAFLVLFLGLIFAVQGLHNYYNVSVNTSRKFLHVSGGVLALFFPRYFTSHWWVLLLCTLAFLLLLITYLKQLLPSVHQTKRSSVGSIIFPIPVYICFLSAENWQNNLLFYLPVSILIVSDTTAEWAGRKWGHTSKTFFQGQKTIAGSLGFAISALTITILWAMAFKVPFGKIIWISFLISGITTIAELISLKGVDNLTVPVTALIVLLLFM